ncbi:MAG: TQO small subunit DoxD [Gaiellaceae bacterium]
MGFRLALGIMFLSVWGSNLDKSLYDPGPYANLIGVYVDEGDAPDFWKEFMGFVADHAGVASKLQLLTELALGVLLTLGLATRAAGTVAGFFLTALWVSEVGVPNEWVWSLVFPALAAFAVALLSAGRAYGLDGVLLERAPLNRLPRWATG